MQTNAINVIKNIKIEDSPTPTLSLLALSRLLVLRHLQELSLVCVLGVLRIGDVYPRIRIYPSLKPGQEGTESRIRKKEFKGIVKWHGRGVVSDINR